MLLKYKFFVCLDVAELGISNDNEYSTDINHNFVDLVVSSDKTAEFIHRTQQYQRWFTEITEKRTSAAKLIEQSISKDRFAVSSSFYDDGFE
ncbi:unnamed protein product [Rotaria sordida]|uniref:Uncharacterized protein n=1 Tax=Rotaria sordida TaxID=392033 RepID=A0A814ZQP1_9BILA|nr:unnamed protein product [Rotaria sordida]CAF1528035.1 unnamed protein product [Rotaria sordida]